MPIHQLLTAKDLQEYDQWIRQHSDGTLWQSLERKAYLEALGKKVRIYVEKENDAIVSSALVSVDTTSVNLSTWEIPRGPIGNSRLLMNHIIADAKKDKCFALFMSPMNDVSGSRYPVSDSNRHIHCEATRIINLSVSEEEILKQMKQKGRYNIRVAEKHGVVVKESGDVESFYKIVKETGQRDNFTTLSKEQYSKFLTEIPNTFLLLAYEDCSVV